MKELKMLAIGVISVCVFASLWLFAATDAFASPDPLDALEQQLRTPSEAEQALERLVQYDQLEREQRDTVLELFFPDLKFLEPAMLSEHDLQREFAQREE